MTLEPRAINTYIFHSARGRESPNTGIYILNLTKPFVRKTSLCSNHRDSLEYLKLKNRDACDELVFEVKCILLFALAFVLYRS